MATRAMATHNGPPSKSNTPPNQTLYITSLPPSRILPKSALRLSLYTLFSTHGPILDIVALRTAKMRDQAHVVFRDVRDAAAALRAEDGREFFGMELRVSFARGRSHVLGRLDGTAGMGKMGGGTGGGAGDGEVKSLQQAIFGGVTGVGVGAVASLPPIPPPSSTANMKEGQGEKLEGKGSGDVSRGTSEGPQGVKRAREESDEEGAPMEEESDEDVEMEEESGDSD